MPRERTAPFEQSDASEKSSTLIEVKALCDPWLNVDYDDNIVLTKVRTLFT